MEEQLKFEDVLKAINSIQEYRPRSTLTFFAYWAWWEGMGRPDDFYGTPMLVYCSQDRQYHTPQEIKERGW